MALEFRLYRDPLEILINEEARTCKGCAIEREALGKKYCGLDKQWGKRCKQYQEVKCQLPA